MTGKYGRLLAAVIVVAATTVSCSQTTPFALKCKSVNEAGTNDELFVFDPGARMAYRQIAQGWERQVPVEISEARIVGQIPPAPGQVGVRYSFDRQSGTGERFIGNSEVGVGLSWRLEDCTEAPVPEGWAAREPGSTG
jgi:hypothetical protein